MTNAQIILNESFNLMEKGILKGNGTYGTMIDENGKESKVEFPEDIHTFNGWKERGYSVKKGEKSKIKFSIWKYTKKTVKDEDGKEEDKTSMFLKMSAFFTAEQVEKIDA